MLTWAKVDSDNQWYSWEESRAQLQAPGNFANLIQSKVGAEPQKNAKRGPQLP